MNKKKLKHIKAAEGLSVKERIDFYDIPENTQYYQYGTNGGWEKYKGNPVISSAIGTTFDVSVLYDKDETYAKFKMWFSWREKRAIGYSESYDGIHWLIPVVALNTDTTSEWEADEINRPTVIYKDGVYYMWYSGQMSPYRDVGFSRIGMAESIDGIHWKRRKDPVLVPDTDWEQTSIMNPHVLFDEDDKLFKMWYSGGANHEPDAIGYASSRDGLNWEKYSKNPMFTKSDEHIWESHKVCGSCVLKEHGYYYMFYIGHVHEERAQVGLARSKDGVSNWEKHPDNPLICPTQGDFDSVSVYKPCVLKIDNCYMMWYNGAMYDYEKWVEEQIGLAIFACNSLSW